MVTRRSAGSGLGPLRLVGGLRRLIFLERLRRVDVAERRMRRHELAGGLHPEVLEQDRPERRSLHLTEPREREDVPAELVPSGRVAPDARGIAAIAVAHVYRQLVD